MPIPNLPQAAAQTPPGAVPNQLPPGYFSPQAYGQGQPGMMAPSGLAAPPQAPQAGQPNDYDAFLAAISARGTYDEQMAEIERKQKLADALRYQEGPEGRQAGRVFVAANPLEHLGRGIQMYKAGKQSEELGKERETARTAQQGVYDLMGEWFAKKYGVDPSLPPGTGGG